jgi:hypothetical protein
MPACDGSRERGAALRDVGGAERPGGCADSFSGAVAWAERGRHRGRLLERNHWERTLSSPRAVFLLSDARRPRDITRTAGALGLYQRAALAEALHWPTPFWHLHRHRLRRPEPPSGIRCTAALYLRPWPCDRLVPCTCSLICGAELVMGHSLAVRATACLPRTNTRSQEAMLGGYWLGEHRHPGRIPSNHHAKGQSWTARGAQESYPRCLLDRHRSGCGVILPSKVLRKPTISIAHAYPADST